MTHPERGDGAGSGPAAAGAGTAEPSPVPRISNQGEERLLERLSSTPPRLVLVASDLHLAPGRDPDTGVYSRRENFFAGGAFRRFLSHHRPEAPDAWLVLNGDVFDFIRLMRVPATDADYARWRGRLLRLDEADRAASLPRPLGRVERTYGLKTHDFRTVWKLLVMARGHPVFFDGLSGWLDAGGSLVVSKGNHDPELHWPLVRQALRDELVLRGAPVAAVSERMAFAGEPFTVGNLYVEHGHRHEAMTRVDGPPTLEDSPEEIRLPLGSFVNRYFINHIERLDPFLDNIKPVQDALLELVRKRPLRVLWLYLRAWKFIRRALDIPRPLSRAYGLLAAAVFGLPLATAALIALFLLFPGAGDGLVERIPFLGSRWVRLGGSAGGLLAPGLLPFVVSALREAWRTLRPGSDLDALQEGGARALDRHFGAGGTAAAHRRVYAVMGHTHEQTVVRLPAGGSGDDGKRGDRPGAAEGRGPGRPEKFYVNSGTWIPLWPEDREDLAGRVIYSFVRFEIGPSGEYRHASLEWEDPAGEPRPARILGRRQGPEGGPGGAGRGGS